MAEQSEAVTVIFADGARIVIPRAGLKAYLEEQEKNAAAYRRLTGGSECPPAFLVKKTVDGPLKMPEPAGWITVVHGDGTQAVIRRERLEEYRKRQAQFAELDRKLAGRRNYSPCFLIKEIINGAE